MSETFIHRWRYSSNTIESDGDIESCTDAEKYLHSPHNALGRITSTK